MMTLVASVALTVALQQPISLPSCCPLIHAITPSVVAVVVSVPAK